MNIQPILWVNSNYGIYIPQTFSETTDHSVIFGISQKDLNILSLGPNQETYYDVWNDVLQHAKIFQKETKTYYIVYQSEDGDVWLIPDNMVWNEETDWWSYPEQNE